MSERARSGDIGAGRTRRSWLAILLVVGGLVACAIYPAAAGAAWPFYGHDLSNTRSAGAGGPSPVAAAMLQPMWSFTSTDGDFTGTPVVADGVVVAGSNNGVVDALDASTGSLLWARAVGPQVNGSAAIVGPVVYVPVNIDESNRTGHPSLVALSLIDGKTLWQTTLDEQPGADVFASPVVWKGMVYIGTSAGYAENNLPDAHDRGSVVAVNAATGAIAWKTYTVPAPDDGGSVWSTPAIAPSTGKLYVGTGNAYHAPAAATTDAILELDARTGALIHSSQATPGDVSQAESGTDADFGASANLFTSPTGEPLVGEGDKAGDYWALDRTTLSRVWEAHVGPGGDLGGIIGSTAWDGTALYGPDSLLTETWSLSPGGAVRWTTTETGDHHIGPVAVANGVLYSTDNLGYLTARSTSNGALLASLPLGSPSWGGVSISGGTVFAAVGTQGPKGSIEAFRPCQGLLAGLLGPAGSAITSAGLPTLGSAVHSLGCSLLAPAGS